ncbi:MAG: hypothetical protein HC804_01260 [Anaerolineae bacterium]|nr:hypothetical protein [Anaerolineae bacterium]
MSSPSELASRASVQSLLSAFHQMTDQVIERAIAVQQIPAPTFAEAKRATFIEQLVYGRWPCKIGQPKMNCIMCTAVYPPPILPMHQ